MEETRLIQTIENSVVADLNRIAGSDRPVLLTAPKEPGKEWVAELLHDLSQRNERPFLIINSLSSPSHPPVLELSQPVRRDFGELEQLAASGLLGNLQGGTAWISNMGDLDEHDQQLVLARVSSTLRCRIITGANRQARVSVENGARGAEWEILAMPVLRNAKKTIQFLLNYFLAKANLEWNREVPGFTEEAMQVLQDYAWPGGVQELRELVRDAVFLGANAVEVGEGMLPAAVRSYQAHDPQFLKKAVLKAEYDLICKTLYETRNNKRKAAEILKISRKTLYSKMRIFQEALKPEIALQ